MTARARDFTQVDVFTKVPFKGNPVAVVLDADGMDDQAMQDFAAWTNLSETTFVVPVSDPAADYRVRIFTPKAELPFAGHPTIGTAHAVLEAGLATAKEGRLVQECKAGLVELTLGVEELSFRLPRYAFSAVSSAEATEWIGKGAKVVGEPKWVDVGPVWLIIEISQIAELESLKPDLAALAAYYDALGMDGATLFATDDSGRLVVRSFAPADGIAEDPVCGSGNAAVAAYRLAAGQIDAGASYCVSQGRQVGRDGHVAVRIEGDDIYIGGSAVTCIRGSVLI